MEMSNRISSDEESPTPKSSPQCPVFYTGGGGLFTQYCLRVIKKYINDKMYLFASDLYVRIKDLVVAHSIHKGAVQVPQLSRINFYREKRCEGDFLIYRGGESS